MITLTRIERTALAQGWHRLLDDVLSNGRPVDLPIRLRLSEDESLHHVSAAFAQALADDLLSAQEDDGSFGSIAATSAVVRALLDLRAMPGAEALAERLDFAVEHALRFLAQQQDEEGLLGGSEIDSAIALWQLGVRAEFAAAVRLEELADAVGATRWRCLAPRPVAAV